MRTKSSVQLYLLLGRGLLIAGLVMGLVSPDGYGQEVVEGEVVEREETTSNKGAIYFSNRHFMGGRFAASNDPSGVAWQNDAFDQPFLFKTDAISEISFQQRNDQPGESGDLGIELSNGDILFGSIVGIEDGQLILESKLFGSQRFDSAMVRRIFKWAGGRSQIFSGPGILEDWEVKGDAAVFRANGGQLATSKPMASVYRDIGLTDRCRIEFEVSWEQKPNFVIALGTDGSPEFTKQAFRIEFWGSAIVLLREVGSAAKVSSLGTVDSANGRLRLAIELDQVRQRAIIYSDRGEKLGQIDFDSSEGKVLPGIMLENIHGDFRLHNLRVMHGAGRDASVDELVGAKLVGFAETKLLFETKGEELAIGVDEITAIRLDAVEDADKAPTDPADNSFYLVTHGATQLSGALVKLVDNEIFLQTSYLSKPIGVPIDQIRSLRAEKRNIESVSVSGRQGVLELADTSIMGMLVDSESETDSSCLKFKPIYASNAANLLNTASGKIIYRERESVSDQKNNGRAALPVRRVNRGFLGAVVGALAGNNDENSGVNRHLHLRSGDAVEAKVVSISEEGILIDSLVTGEKLISHQAVKAVELRGAESMPELESGKRARLLTVPRMRKKSPPRHLLVSTDGDFLKGNLVSLNADEAIVENRLDTISLPRRFISKIIWFHEDELVDEDETQTEEALPDAEVDVELAAETASVSQDSSIGGLRVQAIHANGVRLSFQAEQVGSDELVGSSEILGACLVSVKKIDQLLFGSYIESSNRQLPYHQWRLTHAPQPKVLTEGADGMQNAGTSSQLVGAPAPDFKLDLLDGQRFTLSEQKGRVVVLDFWATWCGPCLQAMPMIDEAVEKFDSQDVMLVAVNLQETPDQIKATLKRLGLDPIVALDIDGVAAARYQANAIPQTVVIDRKGIVKRLFVGGGGSLGESLSGAIKLALEDEPGSGVESK